MKIRSKLGVRWNLVEGREELRGVLAGLEAESDQVVTCLAAMQDAEVRDLCFFTSLTINPKTGSAGDTQAFLEQIYSFIENHFFAVQS